MKERNFDVINPVDWPGDVINAPGGEHENLFQVEEEWDSKVEEEWDSKIEEEWDSKIEEEWDSKIILPDYWHHSKIDHSFKYLSQDPSSTHFLSFNSGNFCCVSL